jgi:uncharacterized membrane protein
MPITDEQIKKGSWITDLWARLETYEISDPPPFGPLILALCMYAFIVFAMGSRLLWHDELYTYYIAKVPTWSGFVAAATQVELQPPFPYLLTRISMSMLGDSNLAVRMPEMIAFAVASICLYFFVRRRLGRFYGLTAMLVLWLTPFLQFATEARPYALVIGFLGIAMLGWQEATDGQRRWLGLLAMGFGVSGMLASHVFSPLLVIVLCVAEFVRSLDRRKVDWPIWITLLAPSPIVITYIPMFRRFRGWTALPPAFQASGFKIVSFYVELLSAGSVVLLLALVAALLAYRGQPDVKEPQADFVRKHEAAFVLGLLSLPIIINLVLMRSGGAFWSRYCIATAIGFSLLFVYILAKLTNGSRPAAGITASCILLGMVIGAIFYISHPSERGKIKEVSLKQLDTRLPLVDASGLTFFEMNKREDANVLAHVFYLTDHDAAIRYAHATIFEGTGILRDYFPIRGTVMPYHDFVRQNAHFFVLGTPDYPEDWLIPKLMDDGAELAFKGELRSSYKDNMVFEVTLPATKSPSQK